MMFAIENSVALIRSDIKKRPKFLNSSYVWGRMKDGVCWGVNLNFLNYLNLKALENDVFCRKKVLMLMDNSGIVYQV